MATKKQNSDQSETPQNAYFLSLELENVRCFGERQKIDFSDRDGKPKQWTIILGDNGTGKTTILQATVSMTPEFIVNQQKSDRFPDFGYIIPNTFFRIREYGKPEASLIADEIAEKFAFSKKKNSQSFYIIANTSVKSSLTSASNEKPLRLVTSDSGYEVETIEEKDKNLANVTAKLFAYGASRKAGRTSISEQNEESVFITLFDETTLLLTPEEWLIRSNYESLLESEHQEKRKQKLNKIIETLIQILPDISEIRFGEKTINNKFQPIVEFKTPYGWVEAKDLSLGYRTSMAWMVDFASRMFDLYPESENPLAEPAVVLIDEIDLHLHPKWQRDLLDWLSDLCPNTQFIVTTHSPLIVQSAAARDANFAVCRREGDHVVIDQSLDAVKNWRTDQILTSDLFGLETARPKEIEQDLLERQQILSKAKLSKKDENRLKEIEAKVGAIPMMENPLYDKMMDVIFRASEKIEKENNNGK